jgi:hypothetical protein
LIILIGMKKLNYGPASLIANLQDTVASGRSICCSIYDWGQFNGSQPAYNRPKKNVCEWGLALRSSLCILLMLLGLSMKRSGGYYVLGRSLRTHY